MVVKEGRTRVEIRKVGTLGRVSPRYTLVWETHTALLKDFLLSTCCCWDRLRKLPSRGDLEAAYPTSRG
jgi:hypothetical protein